LSLLINRNPLLVNSAMKNFFSVADMLGYSSLILIDPSNTRRLFISRSLSFL
jgi:hypothetical protein